jgi:hypothetical protein
MLGSGWTEIVALVAAFAVAVLATPAGISGAVLLLPFQVSVLGTPSPAVTPTNLLYNVVATPGALYRNWRQGQTGGSLALVLIAGTLPGVGSVLRVEVLPSAHLFDFVVAKVLLPLGTWLALTRPAPAEGQPQPTRARSAVPEPVLTANVGWLAGYRHTCTGVPQLPARWRLDQMLVSERADSASLSPGSAMHRIAAAVTEAAKASSAHLPEKCWTSMPAVNGARAARPVAACWASAGLTCSASSSPARSSPSRSANCERSRATRSAGTRPAAPKSGRGDLRGRDQALKMMADAAVITGRYRRSAAGVKKRTMSSRAVGDRISFCILALSRSIGLIRACICVS